jgi:hypothetical protein
VPEIPPSHRDLLEAAGVAALATIGPDGQPQVTAVWYLLDDDDTVVISLNETRRKIRNLLANPAATLFLIDPAKPHPRDPSYRRTGPGSRPSSGRSGRPPLRHRPPPHGPTRPGPLHRPAAGQTNRDQRLTTSLTSSGKSRWQ